MRRTKSEKINWVSGPSTDLLIGCGLWSLPLMTLTYWASAQSFVAVALAFYFLAMFCNNPHYMATIVRAYGSKNSFNKYRFFTVYLTIILLLTVVILHWRPTLFPWVFTLYIFWSPWHYTGQNFGIAMMMAKRGGAEISHFDRNLIYSAFICSFLFWILSLNTGPSFDAKLLSFNIPAGASRVMQVVIFNVFVVCSVLGVYRISRHSINRHVRFITLLLATQFLWFIAPTGLSTFFSGLTITSNYYSAGILAFMHCAQYLWITHYFAKKEAIESGTDQAWSPRSYYLTLIIGGIALFIPGPWLASWLFDFDLFESLFIFLALVNIHHFILDGAIWKLRDNQIARLLLGRNHAALAEEKSAFTASSASARSTNKPLRSIGWIVCGLILLIGIADQIQYYLTLNNTSASKLERAEFLNANDSRIYFRRAKLLLENRDVTKATNELKRAIALNPRNLTTQMALGELLIGSNNPQEAFKHFEGLAALFRPMVPILKNAGALASSNGQYDKAIDYYEEVIDIVPKDTTSLLAFAEVNQLAGNFTQAIESYERVLKKSADVSTKDGLLIQLKLGYAYMDAGQPEQALLLFESTAQQANEEDDQAVKYEAMNNVARALDSLGRAEEADNVRKVIKVLIEGG